MNNRQLYANGVNRFVLSLIDLVIVLPVCVSEANTHTFCDPKGIANWLFNWIHSRKLNVYANVWKRFVFTAMSDVATMWINHKCVCDFACGDFDSRTFPSIACDRSLSHFGCAKTRTNLFFFHFVAKNSDVELFKHHFRNGLKESCIFSTRSPPRVRQLTSSKTQYEYVWGKCGSYYRLFWYLHQKGVLVANKANLMQPTNPQNTNQPACKNARFHSTWASSVHSFASWLGLRAALLLWCVCVCVSCVGKHFKRMQTIASGERFIFIFCILFFFVFDLIRFNILNVNEMFTA